MIKQRVLARLAAPIGLTMIALPALAQDDRATGARPAELEEITVTARRYEERLRDVPAAISAMSSEYMEAERIDTVDDVVLLTPNATFIRFNKIQPEYNIRGINANAEGSSLEAAVVSYVDDVPVSKDILKNPAMYDMERVEVLRGPQGTSFGRNASAGVVHMITKRPTEAFEAGITGGLGSHELVEVEGFVSGPLSDTVSARLAAHFDSTDGYIEDQSSGEGLNGRENSSVRGSLMFRPSSDLSVYFKAEYNEDDDDGPVRRSRDCNVPQLIAEDDAANRALYDNFPVTPDDDPPPQPGWPATFFDSCDDFETEISTDADFFVKREMINLTTEVVWGLSEGVSLTSVTGYIDGDTDRLQDAQGTPENVLWQRGVQDATIFTQELRVDNHGSGNRLRWLAGAFYLTDDHDKLDENQFFQNGAAGRADTRDTKISTNETDSIGLFGEINYDLTDRLNATVGVRWAKDEKDYTIAHTGRGFAGPIGALAIPEGQTCEDIFDPATCSTQEFIDLFAQPVVTCEEIFRPGPPVPGTNFNCGDANNLAGFSTPVAVNDDWDDVMFKVSVQYDISDEHMVYALFSQGYKAGGFQPEPPNEAVAQISFDKETADNFEIGWKGEIGGRARFSVNGFFLDYNDLQLSQFLNVPGVTFLPQVVGNADGAETTGFEAEASVLVTPNFRINGSLGIQDVELTAPVDTDGDGTPNSETDGIRPDNAPEWTASFNAEYDIQLPGGSILTLRGDYRGRSDVWDDIINRERLAPDGRTLRRLRPSVDIFGARASWTSADDHWKVSLWGQNLSEEIEILNIGPPQPNTTQNPEAFGPSRSYGATASYRF